MRFTPNNFYAETPRVAKYILARNLISYKNEILPQRNNEKTNSLTLYGGISFALFSLLSKNALKV